MRSQICISAAHFIAQWRHNSFVLGSSPSQTCAQLGSGLVHQLIATHLLLVLGQVYTVRLYMVRLRMVRLHMYLTS